MPCDAMRCHEMQKSWASWVPSTSCHPRWRITERAVQRGIPQHTRTRRANAKVFLNAGRVSLNLAVSPVPSQSIARSIQVDGSSWHQRSRWERNPQRTLSMDSIVWIREA
ncbi:hypothetical protein CGRA01v4_09509 [Colletotrichum graminicola]|nr:hypothetical protein CGRA01v4_09509 [Colletotrichum graminicola]